MSKIRHNFGYQLASDRRGTMDKQSGYDMTQMEAVMKVAQNVAELVAERMATRIREEIRVDLANLRQELKEDMRQEMLGKMHPAEHTSQHDRIEKFLKFIEGVQTSFFAKIIGSLLMLGAAAVGGGYLLFN